MENTSIFLDGEHGYSIDVPTVESRRGERHDFLFRTQVMERVFICWDKFTGEWTIFETTESVIIYNIK